ncbi:hypothetical protein ACXI9K_27220, partial [Bacillus cereus]
NLQQLPFLLPISPYLHFLCALLSLTLLLATVALSLTYFFQLAHFLRFAFLIFLNLQQLPFLLPIFDQLATCLRYPFPISFNLQQYNLFLNQVILKKIISF